MAKGICCIEGCERTDLYARDRCERHYQQWWYASRKLIKRPTTEQRFWAKVNKTATCWLWTGGLAGHGYGKFWTGKQTESAHRFAYELQVAPIPYGLEIDHLCGVRACVRGDHLEPVTHQENVLRGGNVGGINARKTHCPQGHPYDPENTGAWGGQRYCRECNRLKKSAQHRQRIRRVRPEQPEVGPANIAKTHCPQGHPYSGPNLRIDTNGGRRCRACESEHNRNRKPGGTQ